MKFELLFLVILLIVTGCAAANNNEETTSQNLTSENSREYTGEEPNTLTNSDLDEFTYENVSELINNPKTKVWFLGYQDKEFLDDNEPGLYANEYIEFIFVQKNEEIIKEYMPISSKALMFSDLSGMSVEELISSLEAGYVNGVEVFDKTNPDEETHLIFPTALEVSPIDDAELEIYMRTDDGSHATFYTYIATSGYLFLGDNRTLETFRIKDCNHTGLDLDGIYSVFCDNDKPDTSHYYAFLS